MCSKIHVSNVVVALFLHCQRGGGKVAHTFSRQSSHPGVPINCGRLRRDRDTQSARDSLSIKGQTNNIHPYAGGKARPRKNYWTGTRNPIQDNKRPESSNKPSLNGEFAEIFVFASAVGV